MADLFKKRFYMHRVNAHARGIPFLFTFEEWKAVWSKSGHWNEYGCHKGQFVMARFSDEGAYELRNVRICRVEENHAENKRRFRPSGALNGAFGKDYWASQAPKDRELRRAAVSHKLKGQKKTDSQRARMSATASSRKCVMRNGRRVWAHPGDVDFPGTY